MMPLTLASVGEENIIRKIGGSAEIRQHLENLGFVVGGSVTVITALGGNVMTDAFGLVALVAMMPLITVQVMGAIYVVKSRHASQEPQLPDFGDNEIIELWEAC